MRTSCLRKILVAHSFALLLAATLTAFSGPSIAGGGIVDVTDVDGNVFRRAGQIAIAAGMGADGTVHGRISLVFRGEFAGYWGAVPGVTHTMRLEGPVSEVSSDGDSIIISGLLTETDYGTGQGVIFIEEAVPFEIIARPGSQSFVMQFCLLPAFEMEVVSGGLTVDMSLEAFEPAGGPSLSTAPGAKTARFECIGRTS